MGFHCTKYVQWQNTLVTIGGCDHHLRFAKSRLMTGGEQFYCFWRNISLSFPFFVWHVIMCAPHHCTQDHCEARTIHNWSKYHCAVCAVHSCTPDHCAVCTIHTPLLTVTLSSLESVQFHIWPLFGVHPTPLLNASLCSVQCAQCTVSCWTIWSVSHTHLITVSMWGLHYALLHAGPLCSVQHTPFYAWPLCRVHHTTFHFAPC